MAEVGSLPPFAVVAVRISGSEFSFERRVYILSLIITSVVDWALTIKCLYLSVQF